MTDYRTASAEQIADMLGTGNNHPEIIERAKELLRHQPFGRDDLMAIAAFRYCLGRMTYIVSDCADWLIQQWPNISKQAQAIIRRDLEEAFQRDDADRLNNSIHKALGHDCDRNEWERVRDHIDAAMQRNG